MKILHALFPLSSTCVFSHPPLGETPMLSVNARSLSYDKVWGLKMANQVYEVTHDGLSAVISAKAATHVLRKAIEAQGHDSKSITGSEMRDVLMGPVYQELTSIMPKDGVERTLKQIIKTLKKQVKAARAAKASEIEEHQDEPSEEPALQAQNEHLESTLIASPVSEESPHAPASALLFDEDDATFNEGMSNAVLESSSENLGSESLGSEDLNTENLNTENLDLENSPFHTQIAPSLSSEVLEPVRLQALTPHPIIPQAVQPLLVPVIKEAKVYSEQDLTGFLMRFAQVENIKIVAIVQNNGVIKESRGSGFDLAAISRIGSMGLKLLSRSRRIHSFYLSHQKGQLFLFPLADHTLIIVGNSDVNIGEVFSTMSTLEESI